MLQIKLIIDFNNNKQGLSSLHGQNKAVEKVNFNVLKIFSFK